MNKGMALIEFLIGFLILSMFVACFFKISIEENEKMQIEKAKEEFSQLDPTKNAKQIEIEIEDEEEQEDIPQIPQKIKDKSLIPQFLEVID